VGDVSMDGNIKLAHGAGGELMDKLINDMIIKHFIKNGQQNIDVPLSALDDSAVIDDIVFTTDSHVIKPLFFPGGDIGSVAVAGTVNDVSVMGAQPIALSAGFILEEGFPMDKFEKIVQSISTTAKIAGVPIITGDTKVMEKNAIQEFVINTSGIGKRTEQLENNFSEVKKYRKFTSKWLLDSNLKEGDKIIISGNIGEHGIALLSFREGYDFHTNIKSDVAPINGLMNKVLAIGGVVTAKDPTRGGIANTLNELSEKSGIGIIAYEENIPIPEGVVAACEMLGIDSLEIGNEGKVVLGVVKEKAEDVLKAMKKHPLGKNAEIIGEVTSTTKEVLLETVVGGKRILHKPLGDPIPRIC
jgi:hydrogenase expression/formation protein HypE